MSMILTPERRLSMGLIPETERRLSVGLTPGSPSVYTLRLHLSAEITKTFTCEDSCNVCDLTDIICIKYGKAVSRMRNEEKEMDIVEFRNTYVLKIRGLDEYLLMPTAKLSSIEYLKNRIRRKKKLDLVLTPLSTLTSNEVDTFMESYLNASGETGDEAFELDEFVLDDAVFVPIWKVDKPIRIRIGGAKNISVGKSGVDTTDAKTFVSVGLYHHGELLSPPIKTKIVPFSSLPSWLMWIEGFPYSAIPRGALLCFTVNIQVKRGLVGKLVDIVLAWGNYQLTDFRDRINAGYCNLKMWANSKVNPMAGFICNSDENAPSLSFELEMVRPIPVFVEPQASELEHILASATRNSPTESEIEKLKQVIKTDPLYHPIKEEQQLLWKSRYFCLANPKSTAKLLLSVPWEDRQCVYELYAMLRNWIPLEPIDALELLNSKFIDRQVRKFALKNLKGMPDSQLQNYLLQLVQALKHELNHDSPLARFLLRRALMNRIQIGQSFFWQLKAELRGANQEKNEWGERFELILEAFLRGCSDLREDFVNQHDMYTQLKATATSIKSVLQEKRREAVKQSLTNLKVPNNGFSLPINPAMRGRSLVLEKCKSMQSKTMPLWLVFDNWDPLGDNVYVIFKAGDDLRQDQLTLQMIRIMDTMWLNAFIDLQTTHYRCISTGPDEGWIEVVTESLTVADIQKMYGGVTAAFSETAIADWLKTIHASDREYQEAVDSFLHSCAASCVATFLLGIGDRHNDNIHTITNAPYTIRRTKTQEFVAGCFKHRTDFG